MKADFILLKVLMKKFSWDTEFVIMNAGVDNTRFPGNHEDIIYILFTDVIPSKDCKLLSFREDNQPIISDLFKFLVPQCMLIFDIKPFVHMALAACKALCWLRKKVWMCRSCHSKSRTSATFPFICWYEDITLFALNKIIFKQIIILTVEEQK